MAHWAELDENNIVKRVIVSDNNDTNGDEGQSWIANNLGGTWVKTSFSGSIRKNYAGIGFTYDAGLDAFIPPNPFPSWSLDIETGQWNPPTAKPNGNYRWDEDSVSWLEIEEI
jgi:hypothetical protein